MLSEVLARCMAAWERDGIRLGPPVPKAVVQQTWASFGHRASADVITLYSTLGGFAEYTLDSTSFWCLLSLRKVMSGSKRHSASCNSAFSTR